MMTRQFLLLIVIQLSWALNAQLPAFEWAKQNLLQNGVFEGHSLGYSVCADWEGSVYTAGLFEGVLDCDPGPDSTLLISNGQTDIFIQKLDSSGNFLWAKQIGGSGYEGGSFYPVPNVRGLQITIDNTGDLVLIGNFGNVVDFDPGQDTFFLGRAEIGSPFILKLNAEGDFIWAKILEGDFSYCKSVSVDKQNNIYLTGGFYQTVDFDPSFENEFFLTSNGLEDIYILKLDSSGKFKWVKQIGSTHQEFGYLIKATDNGAVYLVGVFSDTVDFDPGPFVHMLVGNSFPVGESDESFVLKLDTAGNYLWAANSGSAGLWYTYAMVVDHSDNIFFTGYYPSGTDFDPGEGTFYLPDEKDYFLTKLDASGAFKYAKAMDFGIECIEVDSFGNFYTIALNTLNSFYFQKLDSSGEMIDQYVIGDTTNVGGGVTSLVFDFIEKNGNFFLTGLFKGEVDFDPGTGTTYLTASSWSAFVLKLRKQLDVITHVSNHVDFFPVVKVFPNPTIESFNVSLLNQESFIVSVYAMDGKLLLSRNFNNCQFAQIEIAELPLGMYIVEIRTEDIDTNISKYKLIKQ